MSQSPYTPPPTDSIDPAIHASVTTDAHGNPLPALLPEPRKCSAGWGVNWLTNAFGLFKDNPLLWIGIGLVFFIVLMVVSFLPLVGLFSGFIALIMVGGIIKGCDEQARGGELKFDHLFAGFKTHLTPLLILSALYIVGMIIAFIPMFIALGSMMMPMLNGDVDAMANMSDSTALGLAFGYLVSFALLIPLMMAIWFAPSLIVLHDISAIDAMKKSFKGCLKNILPMFIYGLIVSIALPIIVIFTLGLGFLVIMPIMIMTYYTSYRDVWTTQPMSR